MTLMLTDSDGDHILINSECISSAFQAKVAYPDTYATRIILRERLRSHKRKDGMFTSHTEYNDEEIAVSAQETVDEIFEMLNAHRP